MSQVIDYFIHLFSTEGLPPRWLCGHWPPFQGWFYIVSDLGIWSAYFAIPLLLLKFVGQRKDFPFPKIFWLFAAFIFACGTTHLLDAVMFWWPAYRLSGLIYFVTAVISWVTLFALIPIIPQALSMKSAATFEREIEEHRWTEKTLKESEARFRLLVSSVTDYAIYFMTPEGYISTWNQGAEHLKGYRADEIIGQHFSKFYPEEALDRKFPQYELDTATEIGRFENEGWRVRKDGSQFWANIVITAIRNEQGELIGFSKVTRDLTEKRQAEEKLQKINAELERLVEVRTQQLQQANERYELVVKGSNDAIWDWDIEKDELFWGDRLYELVGQERPAHLPNIKYFETLLHPDDHKRVMSLLQAHLIDPAVKYEAEFRLLHTPSGVYRYCKASGEAKRDTTGKPLRLAGMLTNITERKQAEEALQNSLEREQLALMIVNSIRSEIELETILLKTINILGRFTQADRCVFWLYDAQNHQFVTPMHEYHSSENGDITFIKDTAFPNQPVLAVDIRDQDLINYPDVSQVESLTQEELQSVQERGVKSLLSVPVLYNQKLLGRLQVHSVFEKREWGTDTVALVQQVSDQVAVAIYHAQSLQSVRDLEARKSAIMESSVDAIIIMDHWGKVREWNASAEKIFGYERQEMIGQDMAELIIPKSYRDSHTNGLAHYLKTGEGPIMGKLIEMPALRANGEEFFAELTVSRIPISGSPMFTGTLRDISDRKQSEHALIESEARFRLMADSAPVMIWILNAEPRVTYYNKEALTFIGAQTAEEGLSRGWETDVYPQDLPVVTDIILKAAAAHERYTVECRFRRADGEYRWILATGIPRITSQGELLGFVGTTVDITEHKQVTEALENRVTERTAQLQDTNAQLQAINKELESFSYSVSHDLRTPLRTIDGFSQAILEMYADALDERGKDYLNRVRQGSQQMAKLIDDMLQLSRVTRGELNLEENIDLSQLAQEIVMNLQKDEPERQVTFNIQSDMLVRGDKRLLQAVLQNIIGNSWKYTSKHPSARIEFAQMQEQEVPTYYVKDDGAGFDMQYADKLFGAFQRLHGINEFPGTGVGLATVARIIHRHGGKIWAEAAVEKGATFYFTLQPAYLQEM